MTKRTALGHWWVAGDESTATPGMLEWDTDIDGPANLELIRSLPSHHFELGGYTPFILGVAEGTQYNLLGCSNAGSRSYLFDAASANQHWVVSNVGIGPHLESPGDLFLACSVTMDGLGGWITAEEAQALPVSADGASFQTSVNAEATTVATFEIAAALVQLMTHGEKQRTIGVLSDVECYFMITTQRPRSFEQWKTEVVLPLQALVSISTGSRGSVKTAFFPRLEKDPLMFLRGRWTGQWTYTPTWMLKPLVTARQLEQTIGPSLESWGLVYADHTYAFSTLQGMPLIAAAPQETVAFMTMVSSLEALLDSEPDKRFSSAVLKSMREAISGLIPEDVRVEVLEDLGPLRSARLRTKLMKFISGKPQLFAEVAMEPAYRDWTVRKIADTRNCAAHSAPEACAEAATGLELYALQEFVRMLVNARVLDLLGFSEEQMIERFKDTFGFGTVALLNSAWRTSSISAT